MTSFCVAITGGIGSGKSTAASFFKELGANVINADQISKDLTGKTVIKKKLELMYGKHIFDEQFNLKRKVLAGIIFNNKEQKQALENLLHPLIRQQIIMDIAASTKDYCLIEIPLLKNIDNYPYIKRVLSITVKQEKQLEFATLRDKATTKTIKNIISQQITDKDRLYLSDDIIENNETLDVLKAKCYKLHLMYLKFSKQ